MPSIKQPRESDAVNPSRYKSHRSGVECYQIGNGGRSISVPRFATCGDSMVRAIQ